MKLPTFIQASELRTLMQSAEHGPHLLIVDLSSPDTYRSRHLPGAVHVPSQRLLHGSAPIPNLMPTEQQLNELCSDIGLQPNSLLVAYDDEKNPWAGRLLWCLNALGFERAAVLDGALDAWMQAGLPVESGKVLPRHSDFEKRLDPDFSITKEQLLNQLGDAETRIWDARAPDEYRGEKVVNAAKGGHIPGAINYEWLRTMQEVDGIHRLRDPESIRQELEGLGITPDKTIIMYCQTHRRSGFTYLVAKALGYPRIRCYDGSWFEWGNDPDTPVERC